MRGGDARILKLARVFAEGLFALFADKGHLEALHQVVVGGLVVALCAVEPLAAWDSSLHGGWAVLRRGLTAGRADGDLGVEDVLAAAHQRRAWAAGRAAGAYHMSRGGCGGGGGSI